MNISKLMDCSKLVSVVKYIQSTEINKKVPKHLYGLALKVNSSLTNYVVLDSLTFISIFPMKKENFIYDEAMFYLEEAVPYGEQIRLKQGELCWLPEKEFYLFPEDKLIKIVEQEEILLDQIRFAKQYISCMEDKDIFSGLCTTQIVQNDNSKIIKKNWIHAYQNEELVIDLESFKIYPILILDENKCGIMNSGIEYVYPICPYETKFENGQYVDFFDSNSHIDLLKKLIKACQSFEHQTSTILNFKDYQKGKKI